MPGKGIRLNAPQARPVPEREAAGKMQGGSRIVSSSSRRLLFHFAAPKIGLLPCIIANERKSGCLPHDTGWEGVQMTDKAITAAVPASQETVSDTLWQRWLSFLDVRPGTIATYTRAMHSFFGWLSAQGIQQPLRADIIAYRDSLRARLKAATVQTYMAAVRLFFRWTAQENLYPNVADHVKGAKLLPGYRKDCLTGSQVRAILEEMDRSTIIGLRDYAIMTLMVTTGLRTVSVVKADIDDIRNAGGCTVLYYQGKGRDDKNEYVKVADPVERAIREYLKRRGCSRPDAPLFASAARQNAGGRLSTRSVSGIAKRTMQAAGYDSPRLTAHSLRHTAATLNLLGGGTLEETQQLLGHESISTTMLYSHALKRAENDSENRIAAAIF